MAGKALTFDDVREIGLALPGVTESTMYGEPALKLGRDLLACVPSHKSAEPGSLVVRIDFEQRAALLEEAPEVYYLREHYRGYAAVLVRLSRIRREELRDLLGAACRFVGARGKRAASGKARRSSRSGAGA